MARKGSVDVNRRGFLGSIAAATTSAVAGAVPSAASAAEKAAAKPERGSALPPSAAQNAAAFNTPSKASEGKAPGCGSDFMVDVLQSLKIDYMFANTASSFAPLQESIVNYARNKAPEFITCMHEESSAAMAHGYYKASGQMQAMICHGTVGLQHASMALYNAWCDRVPLLAFLGNDAVSPNRNGNVAWRHSAQDPAAIVRDFTKWDDQPLSLQRFAESTVRGYKLAMTPPMGPVALVADEEIQQEELHDRKKLMIPKLSPMIPPVGEPGALREAARLLVAAERPVIIADRVARTQEGMRLLVELAELLNAPVIDQASRQNFPTTHYLCQSADGGRLVRQADLILGLEVSDFWGQLWQFSMENGFTSKLKPGTKTITLSVNDIFLKSNYQDFQRYVAVDLSISGDAEASLPFLVEAVRSALPNDRKNALAGRAEGFRKAHAQAFEAARVAAASGWDASPVSTARMCMELWQAIRNEDWALVSLGGASTNFVSNWPHRLWPIEKQYQYLGYSGGGGIGYGLPAAVGAALANKKLGRFSVNVQCDGDFMFANGALWTAAHHRIPLLSVMHNNRAYGAETMVVQRLANERNRPIPPTEIGTLIDDPAINFAMLARSMGVHGEGPITNPADLAPALKRAVAVVKSGQPALVDVVTQLR